MSFPMGMELLGHFRDYPEAEIDEDLLEYILTETWWGRAPEGEEQTRHWMVLSTDYINGRSVKLKVWENPDGTRYIETPWYDHTAAQLDDLVRRAKEASE